jgi:hypothetical protein
MMQMIGPASSVDACCDLLSAEHAAHPASPAGQTKHCQQCLIACGAVGSMLTESDQSDLGRAWLGTVLRHPRPAMIALRGLEPEPPLFPPIAA